MLSLMKYLFIFFLIVFIIAPTIGTIIVLAVENYQKHKNKETIEDMEHFEK